MPKANQYSLALFCHTQVFCDLAKFNIAVCEPVVKSVRIYMAKRCDYQHLKTKPKIPTLNNSKTFCSQVLTEKSTFPDFS